MIIGLTYDLRQEYLDMGYSELATAEFDSLETVESIENILQSLGHETVCIGTGRSLTERLVKGERWDLVFNFAEGLNGVAREAQVPAILDMYGIPYTFSDPLVLALTLHKGLTKRVIRDAGLATANFMVIESQYDRPAETLSFEPPFFVKPVAEGTGMGITAKSIVRSRDDLPSVCRELMEQFRQPVLVEEFLSGREFTVGIVGTGRDARVLGTMEIHLLEKAEKDIYSFENKAEWKGRVEYSPVTPENEPLIMDVERLALSSWKVLGCRDGGRIDIRCDRFGKPAFIEVNPLAGLNPTYSDLPILCRFFGISHFQLIEMILSSAIERVKKSYGEFQEIKSHTSEQKRYPSKTADNSDICCQKVAFGEAA
ncbi:DdlB2 [Desulfamplus magnetovallimortis]|uniref:DdlB2 n=1 Tax=Desulfamplus magnetovallimortis TaxID=1246637 RepID=A0A1W1H6T0_9BACT|nr:D-alanine--D-alanine ligase [Desulfamplus magnetovallimortis]SLM28167.1 DdlB2 [Desulfamplus magnetovallimortis]